MRIGISRAAIVRVVLVTAWFVTAGRVPAFAQAVPTPLATQPAGVPSPAQATPASSPSPPAAGLRFDRARVGVVPGTTVAVAVAGGVGVVRATSSDRSVDVVYDAVARRAYLAGRAPGRAVVTVTDDAGAGATLDVLVAPAAGDVPSDVTVRLGGTVSAAFAVDRAIAAIARDAQLQPAATLEAHGIAIAAPLAPGAALEARADVRIDGRGTFVDVVGSTRVHVRVDAYPKLEPDVLLYSDDPERLGAQADGVLFRATVGAGRAARAYVYHVSDVPDRHLFLVVRTAAATARLHVLGAVAGPENAFSFVGHRSTLGYLVERTAQESSIVSASADAPFVLPLGARAMRAGDLVAAIVDLKSLDGDAFTVSVVAVTGDRDPLESLDGAEAAGDGHGRRGEFSLANVAPLALAFAIGGAEPTPFAVGAPTLPNLRAGGRPLGGDYGVVRPIALRVSNPGAAPQSVYFYEQAAGGNATTTLSFTGDAAPVEIPCVRIASNRYTVRAIDLAAGESRTVTGEYMTDGTSYFPLLFGLTATPPSPPPEPSSPDACNPRPPAAGASPFPAASAIPSPSPSPSPPAATPR